MVYKISGTHWKSSHSPTHKIQIQWDWYLRPLLNYTFDYAGVVELHEAASPNQAISRRCQKQMRVEDVQIQQIYRYCRAAVDINHRKYMYFFKFVNYVLHIQMLHVICWFIEQNKLEWWPKNIIGPMNMVSIMWRDVHCFVLGGEMWWGLPEQHQSHIFFLCLLRRDKRKRSLLNCWFGAWGWRDINPDVFQGYLCSGARPIVNGCLMMSVASANWC